MDKSNVEPIPDDITVDRHGIPSRTSTPDPSLRKSSSLDIVEKRPKLKKEASVKGDILLPEKPDVSELAGPAIKQLEFSSAANIHCSSDREGGMKITIPSENTLLLTGLSDNMQVMLHKKCGLASRQEPLTARVFTSESEMDVAEMMAHMGTNNKTKECVGSNNPNNYHVQEPNSRSQQQMTIQQQNKHQTQPLMLTIPAAHSPAMPSMTARDHFKDHRNKSLGCLDPSPPMTDGMALKRVSSTGTPILKRQAHVSDPGSLYPENLSVKKLRDDMQATNLSLKPVKKETPEAKKAHAERLADSLRYHTEILKNSPLVKRPGERNFSGFRHCYANTVGNAVSSSVKAEPQDTSYS